MGRPGACQRTFSTPSDRVQTVPPSPPLSPPTSAMCGTLPGVFITPVISCCSVPTFPEPAELAAAADVITRLAASPQSPQPLALCPAVWEDGAGFSCHTPRAGSGFGRGARTCAKCLTPRVSAAAPRCQALKCHRHTRTHSKESLSFVFRLHCQRANIYLT